MKTIIKSALGDLVRNKYLTILAVLTVVIAAAYIVYILFTVRPSELQLVTHYTAYGVTHLYRDQWFYLLTFGLFGVIAAIFHISVAIKMNMVKGGSMAILFAWMGIGVIILAWVMSASIINVWSPV